MPQIANEVVPLRIAAEFRSDSMRRLLASLQWPERHLLRVCCLTKCRPDPNMPCTANSHTRLVLSYVQSIASVCRFGRLAHRSRIAWRLRSLSRCEYEQKVREMCDQAYERHKLKNDLCFSETDSRRVRRHVPAP